jgi:hypothetical protein
VGNQGFDDPDMGESARGAATECEPDYRPPNAAEPYLVTAVGIVLTASDQIMQHRDNLLRYEATSRGLFPPEWTTGMVYAAGEGKIVTERRLPRVTSGSLSGSTGSSGELEA